MADVDASEVTEFSEFETLPEYVAYSHHEYGAKFLRKLIAGMGLIRRESLEAAADELTAMDLPKVAAIVAKFAAKAPSMTDMCFCPYPQTAENALNIKAWLAGQRHRQQRRRMKRNRLNLSH